MPDWLAIMSSQSGSSLGAVQSTTWTFPPASITSVSSSTTSFRRASKLERTAVVGDSSALAIDPDRSVVARPVCPDCQEIVARWLESLGADTRERGNTRDDELMVSCTEDGEYRFALLRLAMPATE